ncbi:similar to Saccharomyces cerevisiae YLR384C IKI3 Subunit of Elongator complex, which is required for modification of wobble nucleosides in tRNA [Maudiozyma barnettii]|uniref:Elongator complex protein 1 n=1 Tax=Maudiozyma barnettii TaxID=61262 RepID=A0A8H2ZK73_9SACH|nr:Elongator subunit IKI3 [Kazachstania barnettii]CAB4257267.1 similar to Saccharomyces cerevisiae YLR384C IKI3 Subunit of Elongator complex, which is required for modification of wobble nucleosides in tRNA [Kazachstania barnettii]CAD1784532.1 similar to Saccharomyces cerevisiae YLR384C IKI3 Subunit of Elongator complex, which is required for modification of wobble nucleosides in tRNA [Kazachstania barnettii]
MRNLITLNKGTLKPVGSAEELDLALMESCFDTLTDSITCVLGSMEVGMIEVQQYTKTGSKNILASFNIETFDDELLSFIHFADMNQLIFVFRQGDIISATYDPTTFDPQLTVVEIAGSLDGGIEAAEWSLDEETLALVTTDHNMVLLSKMLEPISEYHLSADDLKISKHVTVGWGKKETQFRGKGTRAMERDALASLKASGLVGNQLRDPTMPYMVDTGEITSLDSHKITISWRGDCEYFVTSTIETVEDPDDESSTIKRRGLRVFTREGQLDSASEPVTGMEGQLSWKPQGALIASIERKADRGEDNSLNVIFFERNGLRHGEFDTRLPLEERVLDLAWNSNSEILAILLENRIQLWTSKNYHWYLKQEVYSDNILFIKWHPEKEFTLMYGNNKESVNIVDLAYKMTQGPMLEPFDNGNSLVIDGTTVNVSPLAIANCPPPMYFRDFDAPNNVIDVTVSLSNEIYVAITKDELVLATILGIDELKKGNHPSIACIYPKGDFSSEYDSLRQVAFINDAIVGVLIDSDNLSRIVLINVQDVSEPNVISIVEVYDKVILMRSSFDYNSIVYQTRDGSIIELNSEGETNNVTQFPELVRDFRFKRVHNSHTADEGQWTTESSELVAFGLTNNGKLYANKTLLTSAVTSLEITDNFLLFTTAQHNLQFVHLNTTKFQALPMVENDIEDERVRAIERGSVLVSTIPSKASVILQAPRGNLETIYPRIMVLSEVRKNIVAKKYKDAFIQCRTHRIHLDILYDYAPEVFLENLDLFIQQIDNVDYLNLFVSCLTEDDVTETKYKETLNVGMSDSFEITKKPLTEMQQYIQNKFFDSSKSKINKICSAVLEVLLNNSEYKKKYMQTIITAYATQNPQNLEDALTLISSLEDPKEMDSSVTYLCFLQDVNLVYKVSLSLYDVQLALLVAQKSQMDPREYLPFLQSLHDSQPLRRQFMINDYLSKYEKALEDLVNLEKEDSTVSEELINYVKLHDLYEHALSLYRHDIERQNNIYAHFAKHLISIQQYSDAAIIYEMLGDFTESMNAYVSGKRWEEAIDIANVHQPDAVSIIAEELVTSLTFEHKYIDAAQIELKYLNNTENAMELYCKAYYYASASLIASTAKKTELIEKIIDPALGEGFGTVAELLADCKSQVNSQLRRLRELRTKKEEDPYAFYGQETEQSDDVSIAPSETSTKESFFTRYTGKTGGTAKTGASRRTAKNKRREERKRARGKKGTIYEEEYLVQSIGRLIERLEQTKPDATKLVDGLCRRNKREQAYQIQKTFTEVMDLLRDNVKEIYNISEKDRERVDESGEVYYIPEIPVPEIKSFEKNKIVDF